MAIANFARVSGARGRAARAYAAAKAYASMPDAQRGMLIPANKQRFVPTAGTYPQGFRIGSTHAGIKPRSKLQPDLVLVAADRPSAGAAVFTRSDFPAASITVSKKILEETGGNNLRGVIANSRCANLFTGQAGLDDARTMSLTAAKHVSGEDRNPSSSPFMVMHTGAGGQRLPMANIIEAIPRLKQSMGDSHEHWLEAAKGILTTDTFPKLSSRSFTLPSWPDTTFSIAGITKGAGMVHPNMATTLGILCTDAPITSPALQHALSIAAHKSYNCISIDGDTSTNDMVALFANGAAAEPTHPPISFDAASASQSADFAVFQKILIEFMAELAKLVVRDAEGASKFLTIRIQGSPSYAAARHIASVIARSLLVKTAIYGGDPNWGGILAALGYSLIGTEFAGKGIIVPDLTSVSLVPADGAASLRFVVKGVPQSVDKEAVQRAMAQEDIEMVVHLRDHGRDVPEAEEAVYWTCDLTHDFVTVNADTSME